MIFPDMSKFHVYFFILRMYLTLAADMPLYGIERTMPQYKPAPYQHRCHGRHDLFFLFIHKMKQGEIDGHGTRHGYQSGELLRHGEP